jgi:hypothetical protein
MRQCTKYLAEKDIQRNFAVASVTGIKSLSTSTTVVQHHQQRDHQHQQEREQQQQQRQPSKQHLCRQQ